MPRSTSRLRASAMLDMFLIFSLFSMESTTYSCLESCLATLISETMFSTKSEGDSWPLGHSISAKEQG